MIKTFKCFRFECRVQTFSGETFTPLNTCPVCLTFGSVIIEEVSSADDGDSKTD